MSRYDLFRRRIGPVAFGLAIVLMARDACHKQERTHAAVVLDFGAAEPQVKGVDVDIWSEDDPLAHFHRVALPGHSIGPTKFDLLLPSKDAELRIDVDNGAHKLVVRRIHVDEGATVKVPLGPELTP